MNTTYRNSLRRQRQVLTLFALAAALSACGGGGSDSPVATTGGGAEIPAPAPAPAPVPVPVPVPAPGIAGSPAPAPAPAPSPAPVPAPAPAPAPSAVPISASTAAQPNTRYEVNGDGTTPIDLTLPVTAQAGDIVSVKGVSANPWRLVTSYTAGTTARSPATPYTITTSSLIGNAPSGQIWTPRMPPRQWHWVASDALGSVLVAADIPGNLWISTDAGESWSPTNSPGAQAWVSVAIDRTPSASDPSGTGPLQLLAVAYGGGIWRYDGAGWTPITSSTVELTNREWESIVVNPIGDFVAATLNGPIYYSAGSQVLAASAVGSGTPLVRGWRALSGSGGVLAAASQDGEVWVSADSGRTWTQRNVVIGGTTVVNAWYRLAMRGDLIVVGGRYNSGLYLSRDRGLTWTQAPAPVGDYTAVSISADGQVIGTTLTNGATAATTGSVQLSRDGGASFARLATPGTETNWRAIALSADANMLVVAAGTFGEASGQLYTSLGNRTSYATAPGYIAGRQNDFVEVEYLGDTQWRVRSSTGGPFTFR